MSEGEQGVNRTEQESDGWSAISGGKVRMKQGWERDALGRECSLSVMGEKGVCRYPAVYPARRTVEWTQSRPLFSMRSGYLLKSVYVGIVTDYT